VVAIQFFLIRGCDENMKPSEYLDKYFIYIEQGYDGIESINLYEKKVEIETEEFGCYDLFYPENIDDKFIDKDELINIKDMTCLGLSVGQIQEMINFFQLNGYNPYNKEEFSEQIKFLVIK